MSQTAQVPSITDYVSSASGIEFHRDGRLTAGVSCRFVTEERGVQYILCELSYVSACLRSLPESLPCFLGEFLLSLIAKEKVKASNVG
ncbi:hypothetical protein MLD38_035034 [Melastoma candidum]|uniref:Uncharacterized protein n=1 Tax=Melastoma candidum TaxID=119954 RepID=A0ACB9MFJ8_9MYRT|nr:hypothetical protein MLD38_035034 [Melastoma candidum]